MVGCVGNWRNSIAHGVVIALVAPLVVVIAAIVGPAPVARADTAFSTPDPEPVERIDQQRDVASVAPARLLETRSGPGLDTIDGEYQGIGSIGAGETVALRVTGRGGVPDADVTAVVLNVTAVDPRANGFVTAYPCGVARPNAANLNYGPGENRPNAVLAKVGTGGRVCLFSRSETDLVVDVNGYVGGESSTKAVAPARILETRSEPGLDTIDGAFEGDGPVAGGSTLELTVTGRGGVPAAGVAAVILNVTAVAPRARGFVTAFPCGVARPNAANLNYTPGNNRPNAVMAMVGSGGRVCLYSKSTTDLVVDVNGYVEAAAGSGATPVAPARLLETRSAAGLATVDGAFLGGGAVAGGTTIELQVAGRGGVPETGVGAVMLNVPVTNPHDRGFVTVYPCGVDRPNAASLNYRPGDTVPNAVLARVGEGGSVCLFSRATVDLVVDVNGWFGLAPNQPESNVQVLDDAEIASVVFTTAAVSNAVGDPLVPDPETATITTRQDEALDVGDVVVVERDAEEPYYGRVEERVDSDTVRAEQVSLADVVPVMDVSLVADTATGEVTTTEGSDAVTDVEITPDEKAPGEDQKKKAPCGVEAGVSVEASAIANPGNFVFDVSFSKYSAKLRSARIGYNPYVSARADVSVSGAVSCGISKELFSKKLPTIKFAIAGIPVVVTQELTVSLDGSITASVSGSRSFTADADAFIGMVYEDGQWDRESSIDLSVDQSSTSDVAISLTLAVPSVTYAARAYGIVGFDLTLAPTIALTYRPFARKYIQLTVAVDVSASVVIELDLKVVTFRFSFTFASVRLFGPKELWSLEKSNTNCNTWSGNGSIALADCAALVDIYDTMLGSTWTNAGQWGDNTDPCGGGWTGVTCSGGRVVGLELGGKGLRGDFPSSVGDLTALRDLDLRSAVLGALPTEIGQLTQLRTLDLQFTDLATLPSSIGDLAELTRLDLSGADLTSLPPTIGELTKLEQLELDQNELTSVPRWLGGMTSLELLVLAHNPVQFMPRELYGLPNLYSLYLEGTGIAEVRPEVDGLVSLEILDIGETQVSGLPAEIGNLPRLRDLDVGDAQLTSLPPQIGDIGTLERLMVWNNALTSLPSSIGRLSNLTDLWVWDNSLTTLPDGVGALAQLEHLRAFDNPWGADMTVPLTGLRLNADNLVTLTINSSNGCPLVSDEATRDWLTALDEEWEFGC